MSFKILHISVDGACRSNGQSNPIAAIGVYFEDDEYANEDISAVLRIPEPTSQKAELLAAIRGLEQCYIIANDRAIESSGYLEARGTGVVQLQADSEYVIKSILKWIPKWKQNGWRNARGRPVVNTTLFKRLDELVNEVFPEIGWTVEAIHVAREFNHEADALANSALDEELSLGIAQPLYGTWVTSNKPHLHMCHQREIFTDFAWIMPLELQYHKSNEAEKGMYAIGLGTIELDVLLRDGTRRTLVFRNVLYCPDLKLNLLSNQKMRFNPRTRTALKKGKEVAHAPIKEKLGVLQLADGPRTIWAPQTPKNKRFKMLTSVSVKTPPTRRQPTYVL